MAVLLANAIKFRSLIDQLKKQEFTQFMNKLFVLNKSSLIKTSLFHYFTHSIHNSEADAQDLDNINSILCNIIQSRKKKPKALPTTSIKLNELPKSIIGHTASFLEQCDYFQFEKTNRSIFIGCNSPNMLTQLDLYPIDDYSSISLSKFRSLKKLAINITKFNEFILPNNGQFIMNQLNELSLLAKYQTDFDMAPFIKQNCINMKNIKTLKLSNFDFIFIDADDRFTVHVFCALLTTFPKVEFLELWNVFFDLDTFDASKLKPLCPNLKGLSVIGGQMKSRNSMVNQFGNNLHFLQYDFCHRTRTRTDPSVIDFSTINFSKLQQVLLRRPDMKSITDVLKTGKNIQQFGLYPKRSLILSEQELTNIIPQILKCKSLQYLEIEANGKNCVAILDGIEKGLYQTINWERKQIKIKVCACNRANINIKEMIFNIGRIIYRLLLGSSNINDFMFIFDMNQIRTDLKKQVNVIDILNDLNKLASNIQITVDGLLFLITNQNCQITGFGPRWMMNARF